MNWCPTGKMIILQEHKKELKMILQHYVQQMGSRRSTRQMLTQEEDESLSQIHHKEVMNLHSKKMYEEVSSGIAYVDVVELPCSRSHTWGQQ